MEQPDKIIFIFFSVLCVQSNVYGKQTPYHQANSQPHYL